MKGSTISKCKAAIVLTTLVFAACAGGPTGPTGRPLYYGNGTGASATAALNAAKVDVLTQVVPDLIGPASAAANRDRLEPRLYSSEGVNAYFFLDTTDIVTQGKQGSDYYYQIGIRVNLAALASSLRAIDVYGGQVTPSPADSLALVDRNLPTSPGAAGVSQVSADANTTDTSASADVKSSQAASSSAQATQATQATQAAQAAAAPKLTAAEQAIVEEYLRSLNFMVYFVDDSPEDPFLMKSAVGMANGFLAERGRAVVDLETVERIKADEELVFEQQTGRSVSLIQWIAQKLNADVYAELDARTSAEQSGNSYYGQANLTMKFFESSTGTLLAAVNYKSPRTFSRSSTLDAVNNALQSSVYEAMPVAITQIETVLRAGAEKGIPYRLVLQNTEDARLIRDLARRLESRVGKVETLSQTREESVYRVSFLGRAEDLMDLFFDITDSIPAFSGIELVMLRGRSLTFDTGL